MPFISTATTSYDPATNSYSFNLAENSPAGTIIGRVGFEGGGPGTVYYTILGSDRQKVRLDDDGTLRLANDVVLDFETMPVPQALSIDISVLFFGDDGTFDSAETSGTAIIITDIDEAPEIAVELAAARFAEHSPVPTQIATITGADEDGDDVTYTLSGAHAGLFRVSGNNVVLADSAGFDYETLGQSIDLTVTATSTGSSGTPKTAEQTITIPISDVNEPIRWEVAPDIEAPPTSIFEIAENSAAGTIVGTVTASDGDGDDVSYSLHGAHAGLFAIGADSGVITVAEGAVLDHEAHRDGMIYLRIDATAPHAGGTPSKATREVTITLTNVDEAPELTVTPVATPIDEHSPADTVVARFAASDPDGDPVRVFVTGPNARLFTVVGDTLVVNRPDDLDYETLGSSLEVTLTAVSRAEGKRPLKIGQTFTVQLGDTDEAPVFDRPAYSFDVDENVPGGHVIGTVRAVDPDHDGAVRYALSGAHAALFAIDADSGVITVAEGAVLDYETLGNDPIALGVTATSTRGGVDKTDNAKLAITVNDIPEAPVFQNPEGVPITRLEVNVDENNPGAVIARLNAIDPDGDAPVRYFVMTHRDSFMIDGTNLRLQPDVSLDHEALADGQITVEISAMTRAPDERPLVTRMAVEVAVADLPDIHDLTATHSEISQQDLPALLAAATRVAEFDTQFHSLRFADGVTEIWHRVVDDPNATNGQSTLITGFDGTAGRPVHYALLTGFTDTLTAAHLTDQNIAIKTSIIGRNRGDRYGAALRGTDGDDHIDGGDGRDWLTGGDGDDTLIGGDGGDRLTGGDGDDIFDVSGSLTPHQRYDHYDRILDFTPGRDGDTPLVGAGDKIRITGATTIGYRVIDHNDDGKPDGTFLYDGTDPNSRIYAILRGYTGPLYASDFEGAVTVTAIDDANGLTLRGGDGTQYFYGGDGDDTLIGGAGIGILIGGDGDDTLIGGAGIGVLIGGAGDDIFDVSGSVAPHKRYYNYYNIKDFTPGRDGDTPLADAGDKIRITGATTIGYRVIDHNNDGKADGTLLYDGTDPNGRIYAFLEGYTGPLYASDFDGAVTVTTIEDGLTLRGGGSVDYLYGSAGGDTLIGGNGGDRLYGRDGDDTLIGGNGEDRLFGRDGDDIFDVSDSFAPHRWPDNYDIIMDFVPGRDGDTPLADAGDKIRITGATTIGYRVIDHNNDGKADGTFLYDGADPNGRIYAFLEGYTGPLYASDFDGAVTVTAIEDGLTLRGGGSVDHLYGGDGRDVLTGGDERDTFYVRDTATTLATADRITDFSGQRGDRDNIHIGTGKKTVWYRHMDVDGDGVMDTVLYNNPTGDGGIYAILEDYSDPLTAGEFYGASPIIAEIT